MQLSAMVGRQLPIFSLIVPFWLVAAQVGWRGMVAGLARVPRRAARASASMQFVVSNYHGPWLVDIVSAARLDGRARGAAAVLAARSDEARVNADAPCRRPRRRRRARSPTGSRLSARGCRGCCSRSSSFVWSLPPVKNAAERLVRAADSRCRRCTSPSQKMPPVVAAARRWRRPIFNFNCLSATGTALLLAGIVSGSAARPAARAHSRDSTADAAWRVRISLLTIALMLALGFTTRYSRHRHDHGPRLRAAPAGGSRSSRRSSAGSASRSPAATPRRTSSSAICRKSPPATRPLADPHVRRRTAPAA